MKIIKKSLALMIALCLATAFFTSTVFATFDGSCCAVECSCMGCKCEGDCFCMQKCDCAEMVCYICEAIVKRRETLEQCAPSVIFLYTACAESFLNLAKAPVRFDVLRVCKSDIIEDKVRLNN